MKKISFLCLLILLSACSTPSVSNSNQFGRETQLGAYLWQQRSGEWRALCYQAYNLAKANLAMDLQDKHNRKRAVVFDIDETVLDNSFSGAHEVKNNIPWNSANFNSWVNKAIAETIPGAKEFIDYAFSNRVEVIYISNRTTDQVEATMANFKKLGIQAKKENLIFMSSDWSKEKRRLEVLKKYDVLLYIGDNLHDFNNMFEDKTSDERMKLVDENRQLFGTKFIILPNPLYGDWEKSLPKVEDKRSLLIEKEN